MNEATVPFQTTTDLSHDDSEYHQKDLRYFTHARPEMVELVPSDSRRLLDVGCGRGLFGQLAKQDVEREVWGIELHRASAMEAAQRLDKVIIGAAPDAFRELPDNHFDCIVFNDVLEHLVEPEEVLDAVRCKLAPDGCVLSSIPNIREFQTLCKLLFHKQWEYTDSGILDRTHVRFFTESSMRNMFQRAGYEIEFMKGINRNWRRLPRLLDRLSFGLIRDTMYLQFACRAKLAE